MIIKAVTVSGDEYYAMVEQRDRMREQAQTSRTVAQGRDGLLKQVAAVLRRRPATLDDLEELRFTLTCAGYDCLAGCDQEDE